MLLFCDNGLLYHNNGLLYVFYEYIYCQRSEYSVIRKDLLVEEEEQEQEEETPAKGPEVYF